MRILPLLVALAAVALAGCGTAGLGGVDDVTASSVPDPETDRLGWEDGHWHNDTLAVTNDDGLNGSERRAVFARAKARIEYVRGAEFEEDVAVRTVSRSTFRNRSDGGEAPASLRTFDNAKFEAMFLIGEDRDSIAVQDGNSGSNVLAYYVPANDSITLITDDGTPRLSGEGTLAHELTHALQDQHHNLTGLDPATATRDGVNGRNGLVEGEAQVVQRAYTQRCGEQWECVSAEGGGSGDLPENFNWGVYYLKFFPYADGPDLIAHLRREGGWAAVDDAFADPPATAEQVIHPERYTDRDPPANVSLTDTAEGGWERVRPSTARARPDHGTVGQSGLSAMFAYTLNDRDKTPVVEPRSFYNLDGDQLNRTDPYNYGLPVTDGWEGDRLHVYENDRAGENETAYVWRVAWDSRAEATEFRRGYEELLDYWGAEPVDDRPGTWRIPEGTNGFSDAFRVRQDGDTVTVVNAPQVPALGRVSDRAA